MLRGSLVAGLLAFAVAATAGPARAENAAINTQLYRPSAFPGDYFQARGAALPPHLTVSGAVALSYASGPLRFVSQEGSHAVVDHQLVLDVLASASFFDRVGIGLALPLFLHQRGEDGGFVPFDSFGSFAVGDLRLSPVVVLLDHGGRGFGMALDLTFTIPTAMSGRFAGDAGVTFAPRLALEVAVPRFRAALNLGYLVRKNRTFATVTARDQLFMDVAAGVTLWPDGLEALAELQLATAAAAPFDVAWEQQLEGRLGLGYTFASGWFVRGAAGAGMLDGWGSPDWRILAQAGFAGPVGGGDEPPPIVSGVDRDGDGVPDERDPCPDDSEDLDGFQDADGCPDRDNDSDGVADSADGCPDEAEDPDGFEDGDGCPDRDNDRDGFPDARDRCPDRPETPNGIDDDDGCPDGFPVTIEDGRLVLERPIRFVEPERRKIAPESFGALEQLAAFLEDHPDIVRVRIEAHTDGEGDAEENRVLTRIQAEAVRDYLVALDVDTSRLTAEGFGESRPIAPNTEEWGREENRRIELVIVE